MTLEDYITHLQQICIEFPLFSKLPVVYAVDEEGNSYHKVNSEPTPAHVDDINQHSLEVINYFNGDEDDPDNPSLEDVNCIIIN